MRRVLTAVLSALCLVACASRVSAFAPAGEHACCDLPAQSTLTECCPDAAATHAVVLAPLAPAEAPVAFVLLAPARTSAVVVEPGAPPGPHSLASSVPARAPPVG